MPAWPALMNAATAALYLEMSPSSFLGVARRKGLRPVDLGLALVRWRRSDLDELIGTLPFRGEDHQAIGGPADFDDALERSARRAVRRRTGPTGP